MKCGLFRQELDSSPDLFRMPSARLSQNWPHSTLATDLTQWTVWPLLPSLFQVNCARVIVNPLWHKPDITNGNPPRPTRILSSFKRWGHLRRCTTCVKSVVGGSLSPIMRKMAYCSSWAIELLAVCLNNIHIYVLMAVGRIPRPYLASGLNRNIYITQSKRG